MRLRSLPLELPAYAKISTVLIPLTIIVYGLHTLAGILIPFVFAILFAVLLFPLAHRFEQWNLPRMSINPLAAIVVLILWDNIWGLPGLILALHMTAILKVVFDAVAGLRPFGFLIGEAEKPRPPIQSWQQLADQLPRRVKKVSKVEEKTAVATT